MQFCKVLIVFIYVVTGFTDDFDIADHSILHQLIVQKSHFIYVFSVVMNALRSLNDVR